MKRLLILMTIGQLTFEISNVNAQTCPASLNLTSVITTNQKTSGTLTASGGAVINTGTNISFDAAKIVLQPSFSVKNGATFKAKIKPCAVGSRIGLDRENNSLIIFPNPNSGTFTLTFPDASASYQIEVIDVQGNKVYTESVSEIASKEYAFANLSSGLYVVRITGGGTTHTEKVQIIK